LHGFEFVFRLTDAQVGAQTLQGEGMRSLRETVAKTIPQVGDVVAARMVIAP
jgi:hypothetical protein